MEANQVSSNEGKLHKEEESCLLSDPGLGRVLSAQRMIPRKIGGDSLSWSAIQYRIDWLKKTYGTNLINIPDRQFDVSSAKRNVENYIGTVRVPIGLSGPILVRGEYADGLFCVPMATTEGTVIDGYTRGMIAIAEAGGARTRVEKDEIHISPSFQLKRFEYVQAFADWVAKHFPKIKEEAEATTQHGKLLSIEPRIISGDRVALQMNFYTEDAVGLTIVVIAAARSADYISRECNLVTRYYLRSNFSSDKKPSFFNYINGYGKTVTATVDFSSKVLRRYLYSFPDEMYDFWTSSVFGGLCSGVMGLNAHLANGLAAIYVATGQDIAHIVNASVAHSFVERIEDGLRITVRLPSLLVGTIGGGTGLPAQRECLEILGCYGAGKAKKFAEIVAATLLAGESSICAALASGNNFVKSHIANRARAG